MEDEQQGLIKKAIFAHHLVCSSCGNTLQIVSGAQIEDGIQESVESRYDMKGNAVSFIKPCASCINRITEPVKQLKDAMRAINSI